MISDILDLTNKLKYAGSNNEVKEKLTEITYALGYSCFYFILSRPTRFNQPDPVILSHYDKEWIDRYTDQSYAADDPAVTVSMKSVIPVQWRADVMPHVIPGSIGEKIMNERFCYVEDGISSSIMADGLKSMLCLSYVSDATPDIESAQSLLPIINSSAHYAMAQAHAHQVEQLNEQELTILKLCSTGESAVDIADQLDIGEPAISRQISNILVKMDANNISHAISKGFTSGVLGFDIV